jgi:hypothetical protein
MDTITEGIMKQMYKALSLRRGIANAEGRLAEVRQTAAKQRWKQVIKMKEAAFEQALDNLELNTTQRRAQQIRHGL